MRAVVEAEKIQKKNISIVPLKEGEIVEGKVIGLDRAAIFFDLGAAGTGIIYGQEFKDAKDFLKDLKANDSIWAKVTDSDGENGYVELSLSQAKRELVWKELEEKKTNGQPVQVKIVGANKGGLLAEVSGIAAFLPVSQLSSANYPKVEGGDKMKILKELQKFIGQEMEIKILDLDPKQKKLILSEKAGHANEMKELLKNYQVGDTIQGKITAVVDFGAFISFPLPEEAAESAPRPEPIEGLIHISELDWGLVKDPAQFVKPGQIVQAKIVEITDNRVALSIKALQPKPAETQKESQQDAPKEEPKEA
ncbi:MAG: S1 RNA-binding domain-containing protein [Patescibacteria group bacterium]